MARTLPPSPPKIVLPKGPDARKIGADISAIRKGASLDLVRLWAVVSGQNRTVPIPVNATVSLAKNISTISRYLYVRSVPGSPIATVSLSVNREGPTLSWLYSGNPLADVAEFLLPPAHEVFVFHDALVTVTLQVRELPLEAGFDEGAQR
ncbi:MAG: hypothetical protein UY96_C0010G0009 [Parcubacteria group bacterium GW2011_GWB1_56_8]|nr:MAG: hypothetical protein UY96_C0010G0009 [Parcubacteria group bacterium GW2011_GWB1_56_8]